MYHIYHFHLDFIRTSYNKYVFLLPNIALSQNTTIPLQMAEIIADNRQQLGIWHIPEKGNVEKPFIFVVRMGPNIDTGPSFHDSMTSNVKDYPEQPKKGPIFNTEGNGEPPLKI